MSEDDYSRVPVPLLVATSRTLTVAYRGDCQLVRMAQRDNDPKTASSMLLITYGAACRVR